MSKIENFTFEWELATRRDGTADERTRTLHLSRMLQEDKKTIEFLRSITQIEGIEGIQPAKYSLMVVIAKAFEVTPIIKAIEDAARIFTSVIEAVSLPATAKLNLVK